jgi:hypothetical protein
MNETTLTELKILVERAVRPVRASTSRKRKMREELLAHVTAVFEEEAGRLGDKRAALERTGQRFGNPADLACDLQKSVPARDAIDAFVDRLRFRPGESTLRRALRHAGLVGLLTFALVLAALAGNAPASQWTMELVLYCAFVPLSLFFMVFGFYFQLDWIWQALFGPAGRSWGRVAVVSAAFGVFYTVLLILPGSALAAGDVWSRVLFAVYFAALTVWLSASLAHLGVARIRSHEEWANLQI